MIRKYTLSLAALALTLAAQLHADELDKGFQSPPASAKPHTWWHWMNGNITKEGITADLEAMARVGIGGAQLFNVTEGIPSGPVRFNSPEWRDRVKFAAQEASRLGLELGIANCAGWSAAGGPWIKPEQGMQIVVTSEKQVHGPAAFSEILPQPPTKLNTYRDIAVLAFRNPPDAGGRLQDAAPKVTTSGTPADGSSLITETNGAPVVFARPKPEAPQFIQFEFAKPFVARQLTLRSERLYFCGGRLEVSSDGQNFRTVRDFILPDLTDERQSFSFPPVSARFYRVVFTGLDDLSAHLVIREAGLSPKLGVDNLSGKMFVNRGGSYKPAESVRFKPDDVVAQAGIVDLTSRLGADGRLTWDVPEGDWTILRVGHTPNGVTNHPAPPEGTGLESDKLSREATEAHWAGMMTPLLKELGPLAGKTFNNVHIDSYEVGSQNWTPKFREEFQKRCGYDILPFLPVLAGRVVDSPDVTERFLWDFRRVIADLFAEKFSGGFAELAHKNGLLFSVEPYGNSPSDDMQYGGYADVPISEFWPDGPDVMSKMVASISHVHGKKIIAAEAFTAQPAAGKWLKDPFALKSAGDPQWCRGVNRFVLHCYAHQPWTQPERLPGMTMGQWGTHFGRTTTWWEQSRAWMQYIARSQYLLQQGLFVADVLFFVGDGAPNGLSAGLPPGYDYDGISASDLKLLSVKDGRLVLPSGLSYRMLVLPDATTMTPASIRKIKELTDAGAVVVGPKPVRSPSLENYPQGDEEVRQLAEAAKIITDKSPAQMLAELKVPPDFETVGVPGQAAFIHRVVGDTDIYFVSSPRERPAKLECAFRVSGRVPELWHPDTGRIEDAPVWREENGRTIVPLKLDPVGSVFVVFRKPAADHIVSAQFTATGPDAQTPPPELTILKAEYGIFTTTLAPQTADVTGRVAGQVKDGQRNVSVGNALAGGNDPAPGVVKQLRVDYGGPDARSVSAEEGTVLEVPEGAQIIRAIYGVLKDLPPLTSKTADVTQRVAAQVKGGAVAVRADTALAGTDPAPNVVKELVVDYRHRGAMKTVRVAEGGLLELPEEEPTAGPANGLAVNDAGQPVFWAWQPGKVEAKTAAGRVVKAEELDVPKPVEVSGAWELNFPPNLGAPASVSLPKLVSWTEHPDQGVKYFSGTATYVQEVEIPAELLGEGRSLWLDLGEVKNIAEVFVNGKPLGILWKPPFRTEITSAVQPGKNKFEIQVTNLWPNRLIGDEQLPEDRKWADNLALKEWPQWVLDGKPSPTGRITFTTWHHWKKDNQPLPSGLLGPVTLQTAARVEVK
jgi:hypothetical protein